MRRVLIAALVVGWVGACAPSDVDPAAFDPDAFAAAVPEGFLLGTATAAHQIEGGLEDNWSVWERGAYPDGRPHIEGGEVSGLACDSWHKWPRDLEMQRSLGANAYRMSIDWSRLEPTEGTWDEEAAAQYRAQLAALREAGLRPFVTLYHFTLPVWLYDRGGWESPNAVDAFAWFVRQAGAEFGDLVDDWGTINEPNVVAFQGWIDGTTPPGVQDSVRATQVYATLVEAHAAAYRALEETDLVDADGDGRATYTGLVHHVRVFQPATSSMLDETIATLSDVYWNDAPIEAVRTGRIHMSIPGTVTVDREVAGLKDAMDWLGINYYTGDHVRADLGVPALSVQYVPDDAEKNGLGWEVRARWFEDLLRRFGAFGWPIYVTENGYAGTDDTRRIDFLHGHLQALADAATAGVDVRGYFYWSLMDNFEWAEGTRPDSRFGLFAVDFQDPERTRTARPSADAFREVARALGLETQ